MPTVPIGVILIWPGTNATIPSGWIRKTTLDGKFAKGTDNLVNPNVTGGSDTHTHTSPNHTHTMVNHTHTGNLVRSSGDFETEGGGAGRASRDAHVHSYTTDSLGGGSLVGSVTYAAASSLPPYHEVIFIEPDTTAKSLPDGVIALFGDGDLPTNWDVCDGNNSTPNLVGKYLRGAATAGNAGATGGAVNNEHAINHSHGSIVHSHQASTGSVGESSDGDRGRDGLGGGGSVYDRAHRHVAYLNDTSETPSTYTGNAGIAETVEPLYKKLRAIQNNSGATSKPRGVIGLWTGALINIPQGWFLCNGLNGTPDMRGYHLKITATEAEVETTGGTNTHVHAASNSHTHTAPGTHTHTGASSSGIPGDQYGTGAASDGASKPHSHGSLESCSSNTSSWNSTTVQADSSNNEPAYRTVAFIMFKYETYGGAAVLGSVLNS